MTLRITIVAVTISALAVGVLAGCTSDVPSGGAEEGLSAVSITDYGEVTASLDFEHAVAKLPLDQYSLTSPDYVIRVLHAIAVRKDECMVDAGFPATATSLDWSAYQKEEDRTYGIWSVAYASTYGTDLAHQAGAPTIDTLSMGVDFNKQYSKCTEASKESLMEELLFSQDMNIDAKIRRESAEMTRASEEGQRARADWSACMEERGLVLDQSDGRPSEQYKKQGKEAEIGAIVIEAECAASTGAIQKLYDIQARYEAAYIDAHAAQLDTLTERRDRAIAIFEDAIAGR